MSDKTDNPFDGIFRRVPNWQNMWFYKKTEVLYQMTYVFCKRFLCGYKDRTVDQMVQAARSGKQNIVEGFEDGKTSTEMEFNLLNVARSSIGELRQDYDDYLKSRKLRLWAKGDERYKTMQDFARRHNELSDYEPYFEKWSDEEMANVARTLCYQVDAMMNRYLTNSKDDFIKQGGIKERMYRARTGYREGQDRHLAELEQKVPSLEQQLTASQNETAQWKKKYEDLKQRALKAYNDLKAENERLKEEVEKLKKRQTP